MKVSKKSDEICGRITLDNYVHDIFETCVIGREKGPKVDIALENSQYISRRHLKILARNGDLIMTCLGSNGIFVDDSFYGCGVEDEIMLPHLCVLRFPSTNIVLKCESQKSLLKYPIKKRINSSITENKVGQVTIDELKRFTRNSHKANKLEVDNENDCSNQRHTNSPIDHGDEDTKPPYSYAQLIVQSICSNPHRQMTLSDIYRYISSSFPYYKMNQKGWQNSIRHNLSLNRYFIRVPRSQNKHAKSAYWQIDKHQESILLKQAYWKRRTKGLIGNGSQNNETATDIGDDESSTTTTNQHTTNQHTSNPITTSRKHHNCASHLRKTIEMELETTDNEVQSTNSPHSSLKDAVYQERLLHVSY